MPHGLSEGQVINLHHPEPSHAGEIDVLVDVLRRRHRYFIIRMPVFLPPPAFHPSGQVEILFYRGNTIKQGFGGGGNQGCSYAFGGNFIHRPRLEQVVAGARDGVDPREGVGGEDIDGNLIVRVSLSQSPKFFRARTGI